MIATIRPKPRSPPMTPPTMAPVLDFGVDVLASADVGELELADVDALVSANFGELELVGVDTVEVVNVESVLEVSPEDISSGRSERRHL